MVFAQLSKYIPDLTISPIVILLQATLFSAGLLQKIPRWSR